MRSRHSFFPLVVLWLIASIQARGEAVPRHECFPIERLEPNLRPKAEALLLKLLDSEALYTVVGGIKPVSSSFGTVRFSVEAPDLAKLDEMRKILRVFRCGDDFHADLLVFDAVHEKKRFGHAWIAHRPTLRKAIEEHRAFFAPYGLSAESHPVEVVEKMEHAPISDRLRASGYLFGYPDDAVDFFVKADEEQRTSGDKKKLVPRDFLSVPTVSAETHKFVWAVPKGHQETEPERTIRARAAPILAEYRRRRALYVGEGKPGVAALLRDWFDDGYGQCSPENARFDTTSPTFLVETSRVVSTTVVSAPSNVATPVHAYVPVSPRMSVPVGAMPCVSPAGTSARVRPSRSPFRVVPLVPRFGRPDR